MKRFVFAGLLLLLIAIALPPLLRVRTTPGVQGGLGDVRSIISAEQSYAAMNEGYFDVPACLASPSQCLPLSEDQRRRVSKSSLSAFAVVAVPTPGGGQRRAFCGDSRGFICVRADGTMPGVRAGRCPDGCEALH